MTPGIIFCGWGTRDLVERSLAPWVELRKQGKCVICAVSVRFAGFEGSDDGTREYLRGALERGDIDYLVDGPDNIPETTARSIALSWLKGRGCDLFWQADSDEFPTVEEIDRIVSFVNFYPWITSFNLSLKNYVFDESTYLAEPFTPKRIHRLMCGLSVIDRFYEDNNVQYTRSIGEGKVIISADIEMPAITVPPVVAWIKHLTWQQGPRSRLKQSYQARRWGASTCSFSWDDSKGGLIFNPALPAPKVIRENA